MIGNTKADCVLLTVTLFNKIENIFVFAYCHQVCVIEKKTKITLDENIIIILFFYILTFTNYAKLSLMKSFCEIKYL